MKLIKNVKFIRLAHFVLFVDVLIVAASGITLAINLNIEPAVLVHRICAPILVLLFILHMYIHRDTLRYMLLGPKKQE